MEYNYKIIKQFEAAKVKVTLFESPFIIEDERVYVIISVDKFNGKKLVRFGNKIQTDCIKKTYRNKHYIVGKENE